MSIPPGDMLDTENRGPSMSGGPLVSCVMPTRDRRAFVPRAIEYFQRQDYLNRELVILDDGTDPVSDLVPADPRIRYVRLSGSWTLGTKRNACVEESRGDLIMHWDDDDWMAPHRITYQVDALNREAAEACGVRQMLFYELENGQVWLYEYPAGQKRWLAGGSLLYTRDFWRRSPFPSVQVGSDTRFVWSQHRRLDRAITLSDYNFYVAMIHPGNTSPKALRTSYWSRWNGDIAAIMREDLPFYSSSSATPRERGDAALHPASPAELRETGATVSEQQPSAQSLDPLGTGPSIARELASYLPATIPGRDYLPTAPTTAKEVPGMRKSPAFSIIMVVHNGLEMARLAILKTLRHSTQHNAELVIVDSGSDDGIEQWLPLLAARGDIRLIRCNSNIGHGPGIEMARKETSAPYVVTLDSDAFPLSDDWLPCLRGLLSDSVLVAGIKHHRDYIHPSCLIVARRTLDDLGLTFLNEKDRPGNLDVAERISIEVKRRGYQIAGLRMTSNQRRGSISEPVYLGCEYEGLVYHQWYTTRSLLASTKQVDDVPPGAIEQCLRETIERFQAEPREFTVVMGVRALPGDNDRIRNAVACLQALNLQVLERPRYRLVVVEQDSVSRLKETLSPLVDNYIFARNPGPYNRGWAFNIGAANSPGAAQTAAFCFIDADLLVPPDFLSRNLQAMKMGNRAVSPYTEVSYLDARSTRQAIEDRLIRPMLGIDVGKYGGRIFNTSQGGCICVESSLYFEIGGHNERFRGWGREDREFWDRLKRAAGIEQLPGRLLHLDHPRPAMEDRWALANQRLYEELSYGRARAETGKIGDPYLYTIEEAQGLGEPGNAIGDPRIGRREWENWHTWDVDRIERIVRDEHARDPSASARRRLADIVVSLGDSVLDLGCGPGAMWPHFARHGPRVSWVGVDATLNMVQTAHRLFPDVPVYHADASATPFEDDSFDVVLIRHVLEHLPRDLMERIIAEATRLARRAVVIDFYVPPSIHSSETRRVGERFLETCWRRAEIEGPISAAGWRIRTRDAIATGSNEKDEVWIAIPDSSPQAQERDTGKVDNRHEPDGLAERPRVSIVMPTYQRSHTIFRTVETIQAQAYSDWELIIVDNAGDARYEFDDPRIHLYRHAERHSASYARNHGLQHAKGDLICFFDDDDYMLPGYLDKMVEAFERNPQAKMVRCGMYVERGQVNYSHATPECWLRREFASPTWASDGSGQDQRYFSRIVSAGGWSEESGEIVLIREPLCQANAYPYGGLRSGHY